MATTANFLGPVGSWLNKKGGLGLENQDNWLNTFLFGSQPKTEQVPAISPEQNQLFNQLLSQLSGTQGQGINTIQQMLGGNQQWLEQMQAPSIRAFQEQILPSIAERFAGNTKGSAFSNALTHAGATLAENLASQRASLGMQSQNQGLGFLQQLLSLGLGTKPFGYQQTAGQPGLFQGLAGGVGQGMGRAAGAALF